MQIQLIWALVPARGGSKSIPHKNLAILGGRPLLDYGVLAAKSSGRCTRIICSTDDQKIGDRAVDLGIEVDWRPAILATDEAAVADVAREFLSRQSMKPDILILIQPTSPFLLPRHIDELLDLMLQYPDTKSGQTICPVPHNYHTWNQRLAEDGYVRFMYAEERRVAYNKQHKPKVYSFGNLVAAKPEALIAGMDFFAEPSAGSIINWPFNFDVDSPDDLRLAEVILQTGLVRLDHLN
jgi:CMP-N-acetylneuraminic acid synthetase